METPYCFRKEACELLGVSKNRFYALCRAGLLTLKRFPTYTRKQVVSRAEVLKLREQLTA